MIIKDEIHGNIEFTELEKGIIDTEEFQRLRRIKQLAMTNLVYPSATHTRFEHAIGTLHLSSLICEKLGINGEEKEKIRLYALLHDIGHVAFSHETEKILSNVMGSHEFIGAKKITDTEIADVIGAQYEPEEIIEISKKPFGQIVSSDIGSDRMDYLQRDAHNTGVAYGIIDIDRIIHTVFFEDGILGIKNSGLEAAESLLIGRFLMFSTVYMHPTVRIASAMLQSALLFAIDSGDIQPEEVLNLSDDEVLMRLISSRNENAGIMGRRLIKRDLMKVAYSFELSPETEEKIEELELAAAETAPETILDMPVQISKPVSIMVKTENEMKKLDELSELVNSLKYAEEKRKKVLVLCNRENREDVSRISKEIMQEE
ncbi:HD domain-containing protein [Candidatus Micrarchaeota archaeon]|nr:HD domain-containing protein [Candidatus Micrarchaeota archaeon]